MFRARFVCVNPYFTIQKWGIRGCNVSIMIALEYGSFLAAPHSSRVRNVIEASDMRGYSSVWHVFGRALFLSSTERDWPRLTCVVTLVCGTFSAAPYYSRVRHVLCSTSFESYDIKITCCLYPYMRRTKVHISALTSSLTKRTRTC